MDSRRVEGSHMRRWHLKIRLLAFVCLATGLLALMLAIWKGPRGANCDESEQLDAGEPFAVPVKAERAEFDLEFGPGTKYAVVIGSLGAAESHFDVACLARQIPVATLTRRERLSPLAVHEVIEHDRSVDSGYGSAVPLRPPYEQRATLLPASFSRASVESPSA